MSVRWTNCWALAGFGNEVVGWYPIIYSRLGGNDLLSIRLTGSVALAVVDLTWNGKRKSNFRQIVWCEYIWIYFPCSTLLEGAGWRYTSGVLCASMEFEILFFVTVISVIDMVCPGSGWWSWMERRGMELHLQFFAFTACFHLVYDGLSLRVVYRDVG